VPTYVRPKVAIIEESGSGLGSLIPALAAAMAIGAVVLFIAAHIVLLAVVTIMFAAVMAALAVAMRRAASPRRLAQHMSARYSATVAQAKPAQPVSAPQRRAIGAPAQHVHFHFHGLSAEDIAAVISRQETPGRRGINEGERA